MNVNLSSISSINSGELLTLKHKLNVLEAELSLHTFLKQAWPYIEGNIEFVDGISISKKTISDIKKSLSSSSL